MSDLMPDTCPLISEIGPAREAEILRLHDAGMGPVKLGARFRLAYAKINAIVARELAQRATGGTLEWHRWQHLPVEQKLDWRWAPRENRFVRRYDPLANAEAAAREFEGQDDAAQHELFDDKRPIQETDQDRDAAIRLVVLEARRCCLWCREVAGAQEGRESQAARHDPHRLDPHGATERNHERRA